jgi:hypothetical protein
MRNFLAIILVSSLLTVGGLWTLLMVAHLDSAMGALVTISVLAGLVTIDWLVTRHLNILSPVRVYLVLALALVCFAWAVHWFSFLGPVPTLLLTVGLGALVLTLTLVRKPHARRAREDAGLCTECGYDLRASEERCPECNAPLPESLTRRRRIAEKIRAARQPTATFAAQQPAESAASPDPVPPPPDRNPSPGE